MLSLKSIYNFFILNFILSIVGITGYFINSLNPLIILLFIILKDYGLLYLIDYGTQNKQAIGKRKEIKESYFMEFDSHLIGAILECGYTSLLFNSLPTSFNIFYYILNSFIFEIIFDFFHYWSHRLLHHPYLYKHIHIVHHKFKNPNSKSSFYHHPLDLILTNVIPILLTLYLYPVDQLTFSLLMVYKTFIEIAGHTGKKINASSFVQFKWLPQILGIDLKTEGHDLHHSRNKCNYGKRFKLWDKVFGTYIKN